MYSKIPMPVTDWDKENIKYMFCFFPFIGAVIGLITWLAGYAGQYCGYNGSFVAVVLTLIPVLVTGGIHVDGLLDTSDALSSWREREKRLEILKDSHAGAFAVITACVYFMAMYGGMNQITEMEDQKILYILAVGYAVSRCFSGIGVITLPKANASGTVAEFSRKARDKRVRNILVLYLIMLAGLLLWIQPVWGAAVFITALLVFCFYKCKAMKYFGGTTGDLSGYFLCLCEVWIVLVLAVVTAIYKV